MTTTFSTSAESEQAMLQTQGASLRLGGRLFGAFDLSLRAGERIAILGPSGAGKSTLLKLLAGDLRAHSGSVQLQGQDIHAHTLAELSRLRAVLPQSHDVAFALPVELVIALGRSARRYDPQQKTIARQAASLACAAHLLGRRFDTLSGGEKARVQLARVFAQLWDAQPGLLLVDEPLAALDPGLQFDLADAMASFAQRGGHALQHFERLLLVKDGQLMADVPSSPDAAELLGQLYGVGFSCASNAHGQTVLIAQRRNSQASAELEALAA